MDNQVVSLNVLQCIDDVMKNVCMKEEIRKVQDGINMSYNFIGKYIGFDEGRLKTAYGELAFFCSFETYVQTLTMHELGHAIDLPALEESIARTMEIFTMKKSFTMEEIYQSPDLLEMLIEEDEMNLAFEVTAWKNAYKLNERYQIVNLIDFHSIKNTSLATYNKLSQNHLQVYRQLIKENSLK
ncbi:MULTISPECIES: integrase [unclassified Sporosarcina]|uniref:integrase n=1 Tax=unclassified Sporosarcina TaxID=2647733 RepID=UPI000C16B68D|nr:MULTISPECIES: integrase [unclassified Sporosarcina]PID01951.1 integrase [Sporosarcina sp. P2]PID24319.1 integrase [Sporosarcina sp. P7]